ncbi:pirin family protein [Clostridium sp. D2Q-11]|uniref:Pirin family protein n=1 Tax=Anaeromonas frigoriresistens TaxID=2683708 RepID=A0A942Z996_9FIRM|nr:pirin family protein [Anaeromonas frigoriresistens]MBS4538884.1 pirin family protein [Anaeromonas frigoriresistens]
MINKIENATMGRGEHDWLRSIHHFSFAEYYDPNRMGLGVLRVLNDDLVDSDTGFDLHPHKDMEIISYVVEGELTHGDSMQNDSTIRRGDIQYMSAGKGVYHSEHNKGDTTLRFLQIWIKPDKSSYEPNYGDFSFQWNERKNKWLHMVSSKQGTAPVKINQDADIYVTSLDKDNQIKIEIDNKHQAYLVQIEGKSDINGVGLNTRDAMEIFNEKLNIKAIDKSHILLIKIKK